MSNETVECIYCGKVMPINNDDDVTDIVYAECQLDPDCTDMTLIHQHIACRDCFEKIYGRLA